MTIKTLSFVMVVMLFTMPFLTLAQELPLSQETGNAAQAIIDAKTDASKSDDLLIWGGGSFLSALACGCLGGLAVVAVSQFNTPSPPPARFLGKSNEYVLLYTQTYQNERKRQRTQASLGGCIGGMVVNTLVIWRWWWPTYYQ